jgi:predicted nuclease of restriction endonuclease-like (RecB) superfamily
MVGKNYKMVMVKKTVEKNEFVYEKAINIIEKGRQKIIDSICNESTKSYYLLGRLIVEEEQKGEMRAKYGENMIRNLSKRLTFRFEKGFSTSTLKDCRKFYQKVQSLTGVFEFQKSQSVTDLFEFKLSFTHYIYLMKLDDNEIRFYEKFAIKERLSVRELRRAVETNTILRIKENQTPKILKSNKNNPKEIIKDPYIFDFIGLDEIKRGDENILESKLVEHLEKFLLELGRGFAFVKRQYRISLGEDNFYVDLVFYNIPLKCYVLFELKTCRLKHQDLGQLQMYVNYFDKEIRDRKDNKTLGVLLCSDKNERIVQYTLPNNKQIFASRYKLFLPSQEELEFELSKINVRNKNE